MTKRDAIRLMSDWIAEAEPTIDLPGALGSRLHRWFTREPVEIEQDAVVTVPWLLRQLEDVAEDLTDGIAPFEADVCRWAAQTIRALVRERDGLLALVPKDSAREAR